MSARFAPQYLATRSRLVEVARGIVRLADSSKTPHEVDGKPWDEQFDDSLCILVCGDADVGKSALLSRILELDIAEFDTTDGYAGFDVHLFRGVRPSATDVIRFHRHDQEDLRHIECVESPSLAGLTGEKREQLDSLVEVADVVLWVFSVDNPWSASTWSLLESVSSKVHKRSLVVLNKADERSEQDIEVMMGHMRDLSNQRLSQPVPIKSASTVRDRAADDVRNWVDSSLHHPPARYDQLRTLRKDMEDLMYEIEATVDNRKKSLDGDRGFLASLEADVDRQRERQIQLFAGQGVNLVKVFEEQIEGTLDQVHHRAGVVRSLFDLFGTGAMSVAVEKRLVKRVSEGFVQRVHGDCMSILANCKEQWKKMQPHLEERLGVDACEFEQEHFKELLPGIEARMEKLAKITLHHMKMRSFIEILWSERRGQLKKILMVCLGGLTLSGVLGVLEVPPAPWVALGVLVLSLAVFGYFGFHSIRTRYQLNREVSEVLIDMRMRFTEDVWEGYQDSIREFFNGYTPMFESMRMKIADARDKLEPMQNAWRDHFLELKTVEYEL